MSSWYDDDETTSSGSDTFGFFGDDAATEGAPSDDTSSEGEDTAEAGGGPFGKFKNNIGKKNFTLLIIMLVGMAIIVIIALVFGSDSGQKPNTNKQQTTQQQQSQQTVQQPVTNNSTDWKDMTGAKFETGAEKTALFTVTDYKLYARSTGGKVAPLEVRVELWGALAGYDGIYKIDAPYDTLAVIEQLNTSKGDPLSFNVKFRVGTYGENKVIYDLTP